MIEQIRDILINIQSSTSDTEKINYSLEVCKLVFENTKLDEMQYKNLETEDMIIDSVLFMDDIVKLISDFLTKALNYLDADLKGTDFELEIQENLKKLKSLQVKYTSSTKKYQELKTSQHEIEKMQSEMNEIQLKIDEYAQIDLEKVQIEREEKLQILAELEKTEGDNLVSYKRHIDENQKIDMHCVELSNITKKVKVTLSEMDELLKDKTLNKGSENG